MSQRNKETAKLNLVLHVSKLFKESLRAKGNLSREDLEYVVTTVAKLKDQRLKECVAELIGWGDEERAMLETSASICVELLKISSPQKVAEAATRVEMKYHMKFLDEGDEPVQPEIDALIHDNKRLYESLNNEAAECTKLQNEIDALKAEVNHWKSNHDNMVNRSKVLIDRTDLPLERAKAFNQIEAYQNENAALKAALKAAPTPPAQEDEPSYWLLKSADQDDPFLVDSKDTLELYLNAGLTLEAKLYNRPQSDELRKDAGRYRWLRSRHWNESSIAVVLHPKTSVKLGCDCPSQQRLDEYIDAAMKEMK